MVEKISVEIGLEGGDEVDRQLQGILESGKKTFGGLQDSADQLDFSNISSQFNTVTDTIKTAQQAVKSATGFEQVIQGLKNVEGAFEAVGVAATKMATRMTRSLGIFGVAARSFGPMGIALGVLGGAFVKFGNDASKALSELTAESAKLDLTPQQFDKVSKALTSLGISNDAIVPGLTKLKETFGEFRSVDFSTGIISGDMTKSLENFIGILERMPDTVGRTKFAMANLGDSLGAQVIAGLQTGTISAKNFATALAGVTPATQEQIVQAAKYEQSINKLGNAWTRFKAEVASPILTPVFQFLVSQFPGIKAGIEATKQEFAALGSVINSVATVGAGVIKAMADPILLVISAIGDLIAPLANWNWNPITAGVQVWNDIVSAVRGAGTAISTFISSLTGITWDAISSAGVAAWNAIVTAVQGAGTAITEFVSKIATITWDAISGAGVAAWNAITGAIQNAIDKLLTWIGLKPSGNAPSGQGAPGKAAGGLLGGRGSGTSDSNLAWVSRGEHIMPAHVVRQPGVLGLLEALRRGGGIPGFRGGGAVGGGSTDIFSEALLRKFPFGDTAEDINRIDQNISAIGQEIIALQSYIGAANEDCQKHSAENSGKLDELIQTTDIFAEALLRKFPFGENAAGGLLGGRGSGTSDSNLAWVSRGEYITPARAVAQPGVLAFLEALRHSGGNLSRVLDGMGRFALGGMVPRMPAFAAGGMVGGNLGTLTLGLPSGGSVTVRASASVADQLRHEAALAQVRSGGRKPSRYS